MLKVSNEKVCADHKNISATSMAIDDNQSIISLASKQSIHLINVDQPNDVVCSITRNSKYDPLGSDFHPKHKIFYALSSNNNVEIYSFEQFKSRSSNHSYKFQTTYEDELDGPINDYSKNATFLLRAHTRTITDLNWCPFSYDILATCSIDTFIHLWDLRDSKKPTLSLTSVAGANQVKWNKIDENLIATSHEVDARIWDIRKGNSPVHYIAAHLQKIYGIDWHPNLSTELATCSCDNTVKFWNISDIDLFKNKAESYINTNNRPVWRAKYTPIANGLITSQIKQNLDNSLWLWNTNILDKPVYSFVAPQDLVIDFHFRTNRSQLDKINDTNYYKSKFQDYANFDHETENDENSNTTNHSSNNNNKQHPHFTFEIISWSKDNKLRIWDLKESLPVIDCDVNQLIKYTNRYLQGKFKNKSLITGDYIKNLIKNDKKDNQQIFNNNNELISSNKNDIQINYNNLSNPSFARLNQQYSSSNTDLKELSQFNQFNQLNKKIRKSSMASNSPNFSPTDLKQEFRLIDISNLKNLKFEEMNSIKRYCVIQAKSMYNNFVYRLKITFPFNYPNNQPPRFHYLDSNTNRFDERSKNDQKLYENSKNLLKNTLENTAHMQVKRNRPCLEPCLREFMAQIDAQPNTININVNDTLYGSFHDGNIPFPKTTGARFCGPDLLICYSRPISMTSSKLNNSNDKDSKQEINNSRISEKNATPTPKALSALSHYLNTTATNSSQSNLNSEKEVLPQIFPISVSIFYYTSNRSNNSKSRNKSGKNKPVRNSNWKSLPVYIYNCEKILPCSKYLAENYIFDNNPIKMCTYNAEIAARAGKKDHLNTWSICKLISELNKNQNLNNDNSLMQYPWSVHPFSRNLIDSLIDYYLSVRDVQMAAMLCCCFSLVCSNCKRFSCSGKNCQIFYSQVNEHQQEKKQSKMSSQPVKNSTNSSPYHTIGAPATEPNKTIFDRNTFNNNISFTSSKEIKDLSTQLKSYDIIKRHRSNSWSDIAETNGGSISDLTVIDSTCSVYGSVNSPNNIRPEQIAKNDSTNVFYLGECMSCEKMTNNKNNLNDCFENIKSTNEELIKRDNDLHILDKKKQFLFDCIKQKYADLLFAWKLFEQRACVLNYVKSDNNFQINQFSYDYSARCSICNSFIRNDAQCRRCKRFNIECSVCHLSVHGLATSCVLCGHSGHSEHLKSWFKENDVCPTGCKCYCEFENLTIRM